MRLFALADGANRGGDEKEAEDEDGESGEEIGLRGEGVRDFVGGREAEAGGDGGEGEHGGAHSSDSTP